MSDVMQLARIRQKELNCAIVKHEAEIRKLRKEMEALEDFLGLGQVLVHSASPDARQSLQPGLRDQAKSRSGYDSVVPLVVPVRQT